jgi:hypothetical protein
MFPAWSQWTWGLWPAALWQLILHPGRGTMPHREWVRTTVASLLYCLPNMTLIESYSCRQHHSFQYPGAVWSRHQRGVSRRQSWHVFALWTTAMLHVMTTHTMYLLYNQTEGVIFFYYQMFSCHTHCLMVECEWVSQHISHWGLPLTQWSICNSWNWYDCVPLWFIMTFVLFCSIIYTQQQFFGITIYF